MLTSLSTFLSKGINLGNLGKVKEHAQGQADKRTGLVSKPRGPGPRPLLYNET